MNLFLFDAWSHSISSRSKLVFVGPLVGLCRRVKKKVNESGKSDRVIFTGGSEEDYKYWLELLRLCSVKKVFGERHPPLFLTVLLTESQLS